MFKENQFNQINEFQVVFAVSSFVSNPVHILKETHNSLKNSVMHKFQNKNKFNWSKLFSCENWLVMRMH